MVIITTLTQEMRAGAGTFADAAKILESLMLEKHINHVFIPSIPLRAFSCELYLKSLLAYTGKTVERTHKLYDLYTLLDSTDQVAIKDFFVTEYRKADQSFVATDFDKLIQEISNAFVDWRYFFEGNSDKLNITCLQTFCKSLQQRVAELDVK